MALGEPRLSGEICFYIQRIDGSDIGRIFNVQRLSCQCFIEKPGTACVRAGRRGPYILFQNSLGRRIKCSLQYKQVDIVMAQGKRKMVGKLVTGLVSSVEYAPTAFLSPAATDMFLGNATRSSNWRLQVKSLDERRQTGELCPLRNGFPLEIGQRIQINVHLSKTLLL